MGLSLLLVQVAADSAGTGDHDVSRKRIPALGAEASGDVNWLPA